MSRQSSMNQKRTESTEREEEEENKRIERKRNERKGEWEKGKGNGTGFRKGKGGQREGKELCGLNGIGLGQIRLDWIGS